MKTSVLLVTLLGVALMGEARAQEAAELPEVVRVAEVKSEFVSLPKAAREASSANEWLDQRWLRVEVQFDCLVDWIGQVDVEFYVEAYAYNPTSKEFELRVLRGEQRYLNVPKGKGQFAAMWIHPGALQRFALKGDLRNYEKGQVRVVLKPSGGAEAMGEKEKGYPENWVTLNSSVSDVLIGLMDSPWWPAHARRYNQVRE